MTLSYRVPKTQLFLHAAETVRKDDTPPVDPEIDWTRVRRTRPLDQLLPAARRWADLLPQALRPVHLMEQYPWVANRIAFAWPDPRAVHDVLDDLLIDRRGGRRGFPPCVLVELMMLRSLVDGAHSMDVPTRPDLATRPMRPVSRR
jgi:hypothetical protein